MFDESVDQVLKKICLEIEKRYEVKFLEIETDKDHVHFLIQSIPMYSVTKIAKMIKKYYGKRDFSFSSRSKGAVMGEENFGATGILRIRSANMVMSKL